MKEIKKDIIIGFLIFTLDIALIFFFWKNNILLTSALLIVSAFILFSWSSKEEKILYFACFILGPFYDLILAPAGAWSYGNPTTFGIPIWIYPAYGNSIVAIIKIGKSVARIFFK